MARIDNLNNFCIDIADAIREKKGTTGNLTISEFDNEIRGLQTGNGDISEYFGCDYSNFVPATTEDTFFAYFFKKLPEIYSDNTLTSLNGGFKDIPEGFPVLNLNKLDTSNVTTLSYCFLNFNNSERTEQKLYLSQWDTSKVEEMKATFKNAVCSEYIINEIKNWDVSNVTDFSEFLYGTRGLPNNKLQNINELNNWNMSNATNLNYMLAATSTGNPSIYGECRLPDWNTSKVKSMDYLFASQKEMTLLDVSNWNTSNVTRFLSTFDNDSSLASIIGILDLSSCVVISNIFYRCSELKNVNTINLGKAYTQKSQNYSVYKLILNTSNALTHDSLMNIINGLYDLNLTYDVENGGTLYRQQLVLGTTNLAKLTQDEIAIATDKGWTVS